MGSQVDMTYMPHNNLYRCMVVIVVVKIFDNLAIATNIHLAVIHHETWSCRDSTKLSSREVFHVKCFDGMSSNIFYKYTQCPMMSKHPFFNCSQKILIFPRESCTPTKLNAVFLENSKH